MADGGHEQLEPLPVTAPPEEKADGIPSRVVLVVGTEEDSKPLVDALTGRSPTPSPCRHRMKVKTDGSVLQADLVLWQQHNADAPGEPSKPDVVVVVCSSANEPSLEASSTWKPVIERTGAPVVLLTVGVERALVPKAADSGSDDDEPATEVEPDLLVQDEKVLATAADLGAISCVETCTKVAATVRRAFADVLLAAVDPSKADRKPDLAAFAAAREALLGEAQSKGVNALPRQAPVRNTASENERMKKVFFTLAKEQQPVWKQKTDKEGKVYYKNLATNKNVRTKPADYDGDKTQEDWARDLRRKFEREVAIQRDRYIEQVRETKITRVEDKCKEDVEQWERRKADLGQRKLALEADVRELEEELGALQKVSEENEVHADKIHDLADIKYRKDVAIQERVDGDVTHEQEMAALQKELEALEKTDRANFIKAEAFDQVASENRRLTSTLRGVYEEARNLRQAIKKTDSRLRTVSGECDTASAQCMAIERKIQQHREAIITEKEKLVRLRSRRDRLNNELLLHKGSEQAVGQQLCEWKKEGERLLEMIAEANKKIKEQEQPIRRMIQEERKRAMQRGGPLLLDEEDEVKWKATRTQAGAYKDLTDQEIYSRLKTEHDRLQLEHRFLLKSLGRAVHSSEEQLHGVRDGIVALEAAQRIRGEVHQQLLENFHGRHLVLRDLLDSWKDKLKHLRDRESTLGESLMCLDDQLKLSRSFEMQQALYEQASSMHHVSLKRRKGRRVLKTLLAELTAVEQKISVHEKAIEQDEANTAKLLMEARELLQTVESAKTEPFATSAMAGLNPATQSKLQKAKPREPLRQVKKNTPVGTKSESSAAGETKVVEQQYDYLVESLKREFQTGRAPPRGRKEREQGWRTW